MQKKCFMYALKKAFLFLFYDNLMFNPFDREYKFACLFAFKANCRF